MYVIFSRMVAKSSRFTLWGFGGWGVFAGRRFYVRNRPQPFATVCNRPQPSSSVLNRPRATVVAESCRAYEKSCKRRDFWMFQVMRSFISRGRRCTLWHVALRLLRRKVAVPMVKAAQCVIVWTCQVWRSFVSRGRRGTLCHVDLWPTINRGGRKWPSLWEKSQKAWFLSRVL